MSLEFPARLFDETAAALEELRIAFDRTAHTLARSCTKEAALDSGCLDGAQVPSYELAFANAELLAAKTVLQQVVAGAFVLDRRLALTAAVDAIAAIIERLQTITLDVDVKFEFDQGRVRELRRAVTSGHALNETGRLLCEHSQEWGSVRLSDELLIVQDQFRQFAAKEVAPCAAEIHRRDLTVPHALLRALREMGLFGLSIPEKFGGSAPDDRDDTLTMIVVTEALSEASLGAAGSLITRPEILSRALLTGGTEVQKRHWLPRIASGDTLCAIAITEPDFGSDVAGLQLKGTRTAGGWLLNGAKTWCTFAGKADMLMVVTRTHADKTLGHRGLSVLLVEKPSFAGHEFTVKQPSGGQLSGRAIPTIGYRGMHSFDLAFDEYFVPDANVIGGEAGLGKGFYFTMAGMVGGRMQTAARASGVMRAALNAALRYAIDRKVFGRPLADYGLTRAKLARMAGRYIACRQLTYAVGRMLDRGAGRTEVSLVKLFACRSAEWLTREALQIHGGMGYAEESDVSRYFVDARVLSIFEGAEETLALKVIARSVLEEALQATHARGAV